MRHPHPSFSTSAGRQSNTGLTTLAPFPTWNSRPRSCVPPFRRTYSAYVRRGSERCVARKPRVRVTAQTPLTPGANIATSSANARSSSPTARPSSALNVWHTWMSMSCTQNEPLSEEASERVVGAEPTFSRSEESAQCGGGGASILARSLSFQGYASASSLLRMRWKYTPPRHSPVATEHTTRLHSGLFERRSSIVALGVRIWVAPGPQFFASTATSAAASGTSPRRIAYPTRRRNKAPTPKGAADPLAPGPARANAPAGASTSPSEAATRIAS